MPDYGRPEADLERSLERSLAIYPPLNYGSTLLAQSTGTHAPSGGRKLNGGIMIRSGYKGPTVNIRPPKWTDNSFWIRADNYQDAQYIADAVYHHIGKGPFHFCDANFQYPPLRLADRELLTRDACSAYVESIAKGPALLEKREDYRDRVKELVLKAVKSPEAVLFLSSLRPVARLDTSSEVAEESEVPDDGNEAASIEEESHSAGLPEVEAAGNVDDDYGFTEQGSRSPMEVDDISEQAVQSLVLSPCDVAGTVDPTSGYIPTFGIDWFDSGSILRSDWQSLDTGWSHSGKKAEQHTVPSNLKDFLCTLDKEEEELWSSTDSSDWRSWCPQPNA